MKLRLMLFAGIAAMMAACASEDEVAVNPDPRGDALTFSTSVGHTRATETSVGNLGDFHVVAKGVHPNGNIYDNFLVGSNSGGALATNDHSNIWTLQQNVYWPTSTPYAVFWAYTFSQKKGTEKSVVLPKDVSFSFDENDRTTAKLTSFTPVKNTLTPQTGEYNEWNDGAEQTDMLVAFTSQKRADNASTVGINFKHALSQVRIQAKSDKKAISDHRIVKIKGAWLVNAKDKADFSASYNWDDENKKAEVTDSWTGHEFVSGSFSAYGSFFRTPVVLGRNTGTSYDASAKMLVEESLMLIPQQLTAWNKNHNDEGTEIENNNGAYILLLCRIELEHEGEAHEGATDLDDVKVKDGKHYHQQFPVNSENKYNDAEYGFVCVPVATTFEMGKKYLFTLDICGAVSGAGNYPPDLADQFHKLVPKDPKDSNKYDKFKAWTNEEAINLEIVDRAVKKVGDPVLDAPIQFSVDVIAWEEWTSGDVKF